MENPNVNNGQDTENVVDHGFSYVSSRRRKLKRKGKGMKIALISLLILLAMLVSVSAAVLLPLYEAYRDSYVDIDIVTQTGDFTLPPKPSGFEDEYTEESDTTSPDFGSDPSGSFEVIQTEPPYEEVIVGDPIDVPGINYVSQIDPNILNVLVIGNDSGATSGRTDVMMICSYNKITGEAKLVSLLRDLLVPIRVGENKYQWNRLNAAYALGGNFKGRIALCINTINEVFGMDIQKFVLVNLAGTVKIVDSCGGVDVSLTQQEINWIVWNAGYVSANADGTYHLDGTSALIHMRQRYGGSDFNRTQRQRKVMTALFRQVVSSRDVGEIYTLVKNAFSIVETNIGIDEMLDLAASVVSNGASMGIASHQIPSGNNPRDWKFRSFSITSQKYVTSGGSSIIDINIAAQKALLHRYIYG